MPQDPSPPVPTRITIAAWIITAIVLLLVLFLNLLPALLAGLLIYELVHILAPAMHRRLSDQRAKLIAIFLLSVWVIGLVTGAIVGTIAFFQSDAASVPELLTRMAEILETSRSKIPAWLLAYMPPPPEDFRIAFVEWLRSHAAEAQLMGKEAFRVVAHMVVGMVLGAMIALHKARPIDRRPLAAALTERAARIGYAFRRVVFAQLKISLINTFFTGVYLAFVLPHFGVHLPFTNALIVVTFVVGLLPVVGNLISNTVIVIISLSHSLDAAVSSLVFLVVIHKLEYFLNARIVGTRIQARAWELLTAMLVMEAAFGIAGVVAAPIYYAYIKDELADRGLV